MDALELSELTAVPIQVLGASFYFDPLTRAAGKELGLNAYEFYGLGRGGTLGDVDQSRICEVFYFFDPSVVERFWTNAKTKASPLDIAPAYLQAAFAFADRTFGGIDPSSLATFADAARRVVDTQEPGTCPLVDGYRAFPTPANPVHAAYLGTISLRELRGGLHIHAVRGVGLDPLAACLLQDPALLSFHGYSEDDVPEITEELREQKTRAEELTNAAMARAFGVLSGEDRESVGKVTEQMFEALEHPVSVAG